VTVPIQLCNQFLLPQKMLLTLSNVTFGLKEKSAVQGSLELFSRVGKS
jgi:hypothetical protein